MVQKQIKVCVRTRPTAAFAAGHIQIDADKNAVTIDKKSHDEEPGGVCNNATNTFRFQFHHARSRVVSQGRRGRRGGAPPAGGEHAPT